MSEMFLGGLRAAFARNANRTALEYRDRAYSYAGLESAACRAAGWLQSLGVEPGDRVALATGEKLPFLVAHLGALFAGAAPLPLNPRYTRDELRYFLADSQARLVVAGEENQWLLAELAAELSPPALVVSDQTALDPPAAPFREAVCGPDGVALMLYSSGTTGFPKGVIHTQANVASALAALGDCWRVAGDDRVINTLPLFHIHGLAFATHLTWLAGGAVLLEDAFEPARMLALFGRATVCMAVPTMYYRLLEAPGLAAAARAATGMRLFTCGSAPIRAEILPDLEQALGRPVINRYGMSEAYVITSLPLAGPWPNGSVGLPLKGVSLRVAADDGTACGPGEVGAVQICGPNLFREYWRKPEATAAAFQDGWFDTGDLGQLDANGFLTLVGRKHDLIITHGFNVYPQVVERVIGQCPGVAECAVLGMPDSERGEQVAVAIVAANAGLDEARVRRWCDERLVHYQRPRDIWFVDSLPRNSLGKVLRRELRAARESIQARGASE